MIMNQSLKQYYIDRIENSYRESRPTEKIEIVIEYSDFMIDTIEVMRRWQLDLAFKRIKENTLNRIAYKVI